MSVRSRAANRLRLPLLLPLLPLLLLAVPAACAHGARPAAKAAVYENARGERIVVGPAAITIAGVAYRLTDCSDSQWVCASSDIGFRVSFPRRCPDIAWLAEAGPMKMLSMWPHGGGGRYASRDGAHFIYDWQNRYGIRSIIYDPRTDFAADPSDDRFDGGAVYEKKSGPPLFACR